MRATSVPPLDRVPAHLAVRDLPSHLTAPLPTADEYLVESVIAHTLNGSTNDEVRQMIAEHTATKFPSIYQRLAPMPVEEETSHGNTATSLRFSRAQERLQRAPPLEQFDAINQLKRHHAFIQQNSLGQSLPAQSLEKILQGPQFRKPSDVYKDQMADPAAPPNVSVTQSFSPSF